jgi:hypothetical protein
MEINRNFRLSPDKYFHDVVSKTQIYLHHTVGGSALSTFKYWQNQSNRVATAYIIERDGTIYEVFDPHYWAWHLGLKTDVNTIANKQSIGIELASEGALRSGKELNDKLGYKRFDENYLYGFDIDVVPFANAKKIYHINNDKQKYWQGSFRGYNYFDAYDEPQVISANKLILYLCELFGISKHTIGNDYFSYKPELITKFSGVLTHCNVRIDKSDVCPNWDFKRTERVLRGIE